MAKIYLNPSNQASAYITGGNEEQYMNLIADAMIPYLRSSGIQFERRNPGESLTEVIDFSNEGVYDLFFSLQSTSAPPYLSGSLRGPEIYYYAYSPRGQVAANLIANNLKAIYPRPNMVITMPNKIMSELRETIPVAVLADIGYHDNIEDAQWIKENIDGIARQLVLSIAEYLGTPFVDIH